MFEFCKKFSLPSIMVGALTQSYVKNGGSKIRLHKTLERYSHQSLNTSFEDKLKIRRHRHQIFIVRPISKCEFFIFRRVLVKGKFTLISQVAYR